MRTGSRFAMWVALCCVAALVTGCAAGGGGDGSGSAGDPIRIGAVLSLTGTYAGLGVPEQNAIKLEVDRINATGGINGRTVEVLFEDDATDEAQAVQAVTKLVDQDEVVALIGATGTGQTMAVRGEVDKAGIPQVSLAGGTVVTGEFDPLVFQTPWSNNLVVPFVLAHMKKTGYSKLALLTDTGGYGKDGLAVIKASLANGGYDMTVVAEETFNPGDADMTPQLTKIRESGAEAVLMWTAGAEAATIAKNREQLGLAAPLVGGSGIARKEFIEGAGSAAEGVVFGTGRILVPSSWGEGSPEYQVATDFIERYEAAYGEKPDIFAGHAYDAFNLIVEAAKRLPADFTPQQLRDEIEKTNAWLGIGGRFTFSETDHNGLTEADLVMYRIEDGEWTLVQ